MGMAATTPEHIALGQPAGDDAAKVGRFVNPVVKYGKIRGHRTELRSKGKGSLGIIFGNPADWIFARQKGITHDQVKSSFGVFPQHFFEISGGYFFGEFIFDVAHFLLGLQTGLMDHAVPGFLNGCLKNSGNFKRFCITCGKGK